MFVGPNILKHATDHKRDNCVCVTIPLYICIKQGFVFKKFCPNLTIKKDDVTITPTHHEYLAGHIHIKSNNIV